MTVYEKFITGQIPLMLPVSLKDTDIPEQLRASIPIDCTNVISMASHHFETSRISQMTSEMHVRSPFPITWFEFPAKHYRTAVILMSEVASGPYFERVIMSFVEENGRLHGPLSITRYDVTDTGGYSPANPTYFDPNGNVLKLPTRIPNEYETIKPFLTNQTGVFLHYTLFFSGLIQCKNVRLVDTEPTLNRQQRRNRDRRGIPTVTYKTIQIDPNRTTDVGRPHTSTSGDLLPLHIVRGNFATYTEERPLFGRYVGTFWRPAHIRGNAERGVVQHAYTVDAPEETQS